MACIELAALVGLFASPLMAACCPSDLMTAPSHAAQDGGEEKPVPVGNHLLSTLASPPTRENAETRQRKDITDT
jgi:hypothetical protein